MPDKIDKVIATNLTALRAKYGADGLTKIQAAVRNLIDADKKRGLTTVLFGLDQAADMKKVKATTVTSAADPKQNKNAVDALFKSLAPDYLMLLGAPDVVPHQDLKSPTFSPPDEPDEFAFGDIPYACEAPYSQKPQDFFGPTRVVGRLPDIQGGSDPQYLIGLLKLAASYKSQPDTAYRGYFGISAEIWSGSTAMSLANTFGDSKAMKTVPKSKPSWPADSLGKLSHFINCHGASRNRHFFGQPASGEEEYPTALDAAFLDNKISEGTVAAVECCYGAQLYNPHTNHLGICSTYLGDGAFGFLGSTTIAYGPADGNDQADLICQFFLQNLLLGASLGRATLEARQKFVHKTSMSDPSNVKTIAQFNLYGDPSLTPVATAHAVVPTGAKAGAKAAAKKLSATALRVERSERRRDLFNRGLALAKSQPTIRKSSKVAKGPAKTALDKVAKANGIVPTSTLSFEVTSPPISKAMPKAMIAKDLMPSRVHMCIGKLNGSAKKKASKKRGDDDASGVVTMVALIIKEVDGEIVSTTKIYAK
jgi:hypothetical protein